MTATGNRRKANRRYEMPECEPMKMFCGFPVIVPVEPMLAAVARATRCGIGSNRNRRATCSTSGVKVRQTMSLIRKADSRPESPIVTPSRPSGVRIRRRAHSLNCRKNPESRRKAITTIMPNKIASVL